MTEGLTNRLGIHSSRRHREAEAVAHGVGAAWQRRGPFGSRPRYWLKATIFKDVISTCLDNTLGEIDERDFLPSQHFLASMLFFAAIAASRIPPLQR